MVFLVKLSVVTAVIVSMLLTGIAAAESKSMRTNAPADKSILYLFRPYRGCQSELDFDFTINGSYSSSLPNGTYLRMLMEPGKYEVVMLSNSIKNIYIDQKVTIDASPGKTQYIMMESTCRNNIPNVLAKVDSATGRYELEHIKPADPDREEVYLFASGQQANLPHSGYMSKPTSIPPTVTGYKMRSDVDDIPSARVKSQNRNYAIVIGIEQYRQKLPDADFALQDAILVSEYLIKTLGYPEENVITLMNERAGLGDFVKYFEKWLPNNVEAGSTVFVYYSGHGAPNPKTGDAYLVPFDGDPTFIDETGYSLKRMYSALGKLSSKEVIVALDSCFSGAGGRSVLAKGARPIVMSIENSFQLNKKISVLSASGGDQVSSTYDEKGHGLFTYFMLKGIKNEDVIMNDGSLDISLLYAYIKPQVSNIARKKYNNEQTPQLIGGGK